AYKFCYLSVRVYLSFHDPAPTPSSTLSLHDALPICSTRPGTPARPSTPSSSSRRKDGPLSRRRRATNRAPRATRSSSPAWRRARSEEHTSELQSRFDLVCRLLLEKKN